MRGRERRRAWRRRFKLLWIYIEMTALVLMAVSLVAVITAIYSVSKMLPTGLDIASYRPTEATKIISCDGTVLAEIFEENREVVPLSDIPKDLQNATVAIEDERFYRHFGVDFRGIIRALYQNLRTGHIAQGGSTLTQQLARNIYLTRERKLSRKLQEIVLAFQLERHFSKQEILELYLNQVYYGSGAYGVQTASRVYFGRDAKDLTLSECALIAGLPQKPSSYSPYEDKEAATNRRNAVLNRMVELGYITSEQCDETKEEDVQLVGRQPGGIARYKAPWFVTYVIKELTDKYGPDLIYRGGLRVYTTLNYEMQKIAEQQLREQVKLAKWRRVSQGALICIDPENGYIKAMVGGVNPDFAKDQFNRAVQARRQPGSAFKAFVYTAAVDNGYDKNYRISNERVTYSGYGSKPWSPRNYDGHYGGTYSIKMAVAKSVNICAVRMAEQVGIQKVIEYARLLGIRSPLNPNLSLALGASEVTPLEICSAYGVFAAKGVRAEPMAIERITEANGNRDGSILEENRPVTRQVISEQTAETMDEIFRAVVTSGTGSQAGRVRNAHGKTGTTSNDRSAWFIGYTPELVTAVWAGNDDNTPMRGVYGGNVCAPAWAGFMREAVRIHAKEHQKETYKPKPLGDERLVRSSEDQRYQRQERNERQEPSTNRVTVTICAESGQLGTSSCPTTYTVSYDADTALPSKCTIHGASRPSGGAETTTTPTTTPPPTSRPSTGPSRPGGTSTSNGQYVTITICADSGQIANIYCPETVTRQFRTDEAPSKVCRLHRPPTQ